MNCECEPTEVTLCTDCTAAIIQAEEDMRAEDAYERSTQ